MGTMEYAAELPYPEIECAENLSDGKLLMPSYGGRGR